MSSGIVVGGTYQHYKGNSYQVIGTARHSETLEEMIVYKSLYETPKFPEGSIWVRPKQMFEEYVEYKGMPVPRFGYISTSV